VRRGGSCLDSVGITCVRYMMVRLSLWLTLIQGLIIAIIQVTGISSKHAAKYLSYMKVEKRTGSMSIVQLRSTR